jgi:anti-sigma factor RsiW
MTGNVHDRALRLIRAEQAESLSPDDRRWLHKHLADCPDCSQYADALRQALHSLRSLSVRLDPEVTRRTRLKLMARASQLEARQFRFQPLWGTLLLSAFWVFMTSRYLWKGFRWLGERYDLADGIWQAGFLMGWFLPATVAAMILALAWRRRLGMEA